MHALGSNTMALYIALAMTHAMGTVHCTTCDGIFDDTGAT